MRSLAQDYPPPEGKAYDDYFLDLYKMASAGKGSISDTVDRQRNTRAKKNREESDVRTTSRGDVDLSSLGKNPSLTDIVRTAAKQLKREDFD